MAKAEEKKEQGSVKEGEAPSMEEILQSIRGVISGEDASQDDSDILELTEVVEEPGVLTVSKTEEVQTGSEKSILDDIDDALEDDTIKNIPVIDPKPVESEVVIPDIKPVEDDIPPVITKVESDPPPVVVTSKLEDKVITPEIESEEDQDGLDIGTTEVSVKDAQSKSVSPGRLLDEKVAKQSSGTLKELVNTIHEKHVDSPYTRTGTSLEDLVIEAMKPFLADWLNKNLPVIVRKIVEKEVKRLVPKEEDDY